MTSTVCILSNFGILKPTTGITERYVTLTSKSLALKHLDVMKSNIWKNFSPVTRAKRERFGNHFLTRCIYTFLAMFLFSENPKYA